MFGKLLKINLTYEEISEVELDKEIIRLFLGGKGLGAYLLYKNLLPNTDPLSPDNILIFLNGPLTGTSFPAASRIAVITKSPLTNIYLDSYSGGFFGVELRKSGYDGIVILGRSKDPVYLWINERDIEIRDAEDLWGLPISLTVENLRRKTHKNAHIASIGPAGENLVRFAAIMIDRDEDPWRAGIAARGGPGAVMGSKNLKAIVIKGNKKRELYDEKEFNKFCVRAFQKIKEDNFAHIRRTLGSSYWVEPMNRFGILPTRNFQQGFIEGHYGLVAGNLRYYVKRDVTCYNCPIACGKVVDIEGKNVKVEYEDIALLGSNNGIKDIRDVARALYLCNEYGLDAISTGGVIGFAMECKEKNILPEAPLFGDAEGQRKLIKDIVYKEGIGKILAEGTKKASEIIGKNTKKFAINIKGMELPGYDPRASWGMALAYATSDRGGCHQRAWTTKAELDGILERFSTKGVSYYVKYLQDERAVAYSLIVCDFSPLSIEDFMKGVKYATGLGYTERDYLKIGERIWNLIRLFNIREGLSKRDDTLPPRFFEDPLPLPPKGKEFIRLSKKEFNHTLYEYYKFRGWDDEGIPTEEKLEELNLDDFILNSKNIGKI